MLVVSVLNDKLGNVSIVDSNISIISAIAESLPKVEITRMVLSGETGKNYSFIAGGVYRQGRWPPLV